MNNLSSDGSCSEYEDEFDMDEETMFADETVGGDVETVTSCFSHPSL